VLEVLDRRDELSGDSLVVPVRDSQIEKTSTVMIPTELSSFSKSHRTVSFSY
jgi:hypothetical protein